MPVMDGYALLEELKKFPERQNVLVTSGYNDSQLSELYNLGALGFLSKPIDTEAVKELIYVSLLRKVDRWAPKYFDQNAIKMQKKISSLNSPEGASEINFGRGGYFFPTKSPPPPVGTVIHFSFAIADHVPIDLLTGTGIVRWIRPLDINNTQGTGYGVEIKHLTDSCRAPFCDWLYRRDFRAYIPSH
jgi:CheY-like chemotaxis protein